MIRDIQNFVSDVDTARQVGTQFNRFEYGYLGEVNAMRTLNANDTVLVMLPPESIMPDIYKNDEEVTCVFHCLIPFNEIGGVQPTNANDRLEFMHDSLKEKMLNTISALLKDKEHKYIVASPLQIVRTSREFNQNYVGLQCTISFRMFSTCVDYSLDHNTNTGI